jgi:hypothetical protein
VDKWVTYVNYSWRRGMLNFPVEISVAFIIIFSQDYMQNCCLIVLALSVS